MNFIMLLKVFRFKIIYVVWFYLYEVEIGKLFFDSRN